jgi:anti-anti-sigma factor
MSDSTYAFQLSGDVDFGLKDELRERAAEFESSSCPNATVDMGQVTFLDSTGLGFLVNLRNIAESRQGRVEVVDPPDVVLRLLRLVNLDGRFDVRRKAGPETEAE